MAFCHPQILVNERRRKFAPKCSSKRHLFVTRASAETPDVGLVPKEGQTGTCCANLWPIPLLGGYNWFLNVYDRNLASSTGAFVVNHDCEKDITIAFEKDRKPSAEHGSKTHTSFGGVAAGNINVLSALSALGYDETRYQLRTFEKGGVEPFFIRRNEVHITRPNDSSKSSDNGPNDPWLDPAPTYSVSTEQPTFEVRDLFPGAGAGPRAATSLEYFTMNLFPIFPFNKYSCFVCVWRQRSDTSPVAIDKRNRGIRLSFFDPLEIPTELEDKPSPVARFAVKEFIGAVTDAGVHELHSQMIRAIEACENMKVASTTDFRIVVDNTPGILSSNRRNELWVEVV
ncbi:hypothetical protein BWQ96_06493 [Gracilariopsis chorda]|uniref:Uncharacterized protein n=1 Tax=Gracilariopsis chorda TaxID=448386 RepID=A0A2V3INU6_9FLOR|nr:hypothetical protein BWQ96_06493 [Gracilariopsis chorda]|eukprot:PXF43761.1 hypothetical protein BWQ96_06493 [Gracilariopsis chorda]